MKQRMPVEKSIGQRASYMSVDLSEELILYAAADAYCSRKVTDIIQNEIKNGNSCFNDEKATSVLKEGTQVIVNFRGKAIARGCIVFNGTFGGHLKWGTKIIGRKKVVVSVRKILNQHHKPILRHHDWPENKDTLHDLWISLNGNLKIVANHGSLSVIQFNQKENNEKTMLKQEF